MCSGTLTRSGGRSCLIILSRLLRRCVFFSLYHSSPHLMCELDQWLVAECSWRRFLCCVDSTSARFWFRNSFELNQNFKFFRSHFIDSWPDCLVRKSVSTPKEKKTSAPKLFIFFLPPSLSFLMTHSSKSSLEFLSLFDLNPTEKKVK